MCASCVLPKQVARILFLSKLWYFDNFFHESTLIPTTQHAYFVSNIKVHWAQKSFLEDDIEDLNFRDKLH